jgi:UDP-glucose 4-epimerase
VLGPPNRPRWSEGVAKALDEYLALAYARQHEVPVIIGRFFNVVGPRQPADFGMVLPRFVDAALAGRPLVVHEDGGQVRAFLHVDDAVRAVVGLMRRRGSTAGVFNIGGDEPVTIHELAETVIAATQPGLEIQYQTYSDVYGPDFEHVARRVPDLTKLRGAIEFVPRYSLEMIVHEAVELAREKRRRP